MPFRPHFSSPQFTEVSLCPHNSVLSPREILANNFSSSCYTFFFKLGHLWYTLICLSEAENKLNHYSINISKTGFISALHTPHYSSFFHSQSVKCQRTCKKNHDGVNPGSLAKEQAELEASPIPSPWFQKGLKDVLSPRGLRGRQL